MHKLHWIPCTVVETIKQHQNVIFIKLWQIANYVYQAFIVSCLACNMHILQNRCSDYVFNRMYDYLPNLQPFGVFLHKTHATHERNDSLFSLLHVYVYVSTYFFIANVSEKLCNCAHIAMH